MSEKNELARLLGTLDAIAASEVLGSPTAALSAKLLREMARDFKDVGEYMMEYSKEGARIPIDLRQYLLLSEKLERWRLLP